MKLIIIGIITLTSLSSIADTHYGSDDLTSINVFDASLQKCEEKLAEVHVLVLERNKALIKLNKCREINGTSYGSVSFH